MPTFNRRAVLNGSLAAFAGLASTPLPSFGANPGADDDEDFWSNVGFEYDLEDRYTMMNGGGNNPLPRGVVNALKRYLEYAASAPRPNNYYLLNHRDQHRTRLAALMNCDAAELALTRNTTEGLNTVASGLEFERGDEVLFSPFEDRYALSSFEPIAARAGIKLTVVDLPIPPTAEQVVEAFAERMSPNTRLLCVSHIVDAWGFVLPVRRLARLAHDAGAQLLVDGALSFGHIPVDLRAMDCDYFATSLHKWLNAPLGTGALFVRGDRIEDLWPLHGVRSNAGDISKFERIGTRDGAAVAAIGQAIDFYEQIGPQRKAARLKTLLERTMAGLSDTPGVRVVTEPDPERRAGLARVVVDGWTGKDLTRTLLDRYSFFVYGNFPGELDGVYVSPNVFNSPGDIDRFCDAIQTIARG